MMPRSINVLIIVFVSLIVIWFSLRFLYIIQSYKIPTPANEPTLKTGERIWASNLLKPEKGKFACFYGTDLWHPEKYVYVYRVCGMPGDVVEIKDGVLYVNNRNYDCFLDLKHRFIISAEDFDTLKEEWNPGENNFYQVNDSVNVFAEDSLAKRFPQLKRVLLPLSFTDIYRKSFFKAMER